MFALPTYKMNCQGSDRAMRAQVQLSSTLRTLKRCVLLGTLGLLAGPAFGQTLRSESIDGPTQLRTAKSNTSHGWFELGDGRLGILGLGAKSGNVLMDASNLNIRLDGTDWPLLGSVEYRLGDAPPTVNAQVLGAILCHDYGANSGLAQWDLHITDVNDDPVVAPLMGVNSLDYQLAVGSGKGKLIPVGDFDVQCYSGDEENEPYPGENDIFVDGFEGDAGPDLEVTFWRESGGTLVRIDDDLVTHQGNSQGGHDYDTTFVVRVENIAGPTPQGAQITNAANDVYLREFVFQDETDNGEPGIVRVDCELYPSGTPCSNNGGDSDGNGSEPLVQGVGTLQPNEKREFKLTRASRGSLDGTDALVQLAAFSSNESKLNRANNSRSLRVRIVDRFTIGMRVETLEGGQVVPHPGNTLEVDPMSFPQGFNCSNDANAVTCDPGATGLRFVATADSGYSFAEFTGCEDQGAEDTNDSSVFVTSNAGACELTATFNKNPHVTVNVTGNGAVEHNGDPLAHGIAYEVVYGAPFAISLSPDSYYEGAASGCGIVAGGSANEWEIASVTANCTIDVEFSPILYTVTAEVLGNGGLVGGGPGSLGSTYSISGPYGGDFYFFYTVNPGYVLHEADVDTSGCDGSIYEFEPSGLPYTIYLTNVSGDGNGNRECTITLNYRQQHQVQAGIDPNGTNDGTIGTSANPTGSGPISANVWHGDSFSVYVKPNNPAKHRVETTVDSCGFVQQQSDPEEWKIGAVLDDCSATFEFVIRNYAVNFEMNGGNAYFDPGTILSAIPYGTELEFVVVAPSGTNFNLVNTNAESTCHEITHVTSQTYKVSSPGIEGDCGIKLMFD